MLLSFDISTSVIGFSVFDDNGKLLALDYVKFKSKQTLFEKLIHFQDKMEMYTSDEVKKDIKYISIEEPLKKFMGKFSNASTISMLNFFNGMISSYLYTTFGIEPLYLNVNSARATAFPGMKFETKDRKHEIWRRVMEREPQINWKYSTRTSKLMAENYDMSDAYVIGLAQLRVLNERGELTIDFKDN